MWSSPPIILRVFKPKISDFFSYFAFSFKEVPDVDLAPYNFESLHANKLLPKPVFCTRSLCQGLVLQEIF